MSSDPPAFGPVPANAVTASGVPASAVSADGVSGDGLSADELPAALISADAPPFDAVILAGGQARRLGGADKPALTVGGIPLAAAVARAAVAAGARRVILVGPPRPALTAAVPAPPGGLRTVREDPPGGGPVPALRAGLAEVTAPLVAILAADLPFLRAPHLHALLQAAAHGAAAAHSGPGAVLTDDDGRPQWLTGAWAVAPLRAALSPYQGSSLRALLAPLSPALLTCPPAPGEPPSWLDCDTPADLAAAQAWSAPPPAVDNEVTHPAGPKGQLVTTVESWIEAACAELGLAPSDVPVRAVLDLARDVAHQVERPAAPLTAFLLGLAVGHGRDLPEAAAALEQLAATWTAPS